LYAVNPTSKQKWNFTTGRAVRSTPAIGDDGTVYVGSEDGWLWAINPNGSQKWKFRTNNAIQSSPTIGPDGTIYFGSFDYRLYAVNNDGTLKWKYKTSGGISSSPAIDDNGTIYIGSLDKNLYAINPDGSLKWSFATGDQVRSSPAVGDDGTIYIGSDDGKLYAINPNGSKKWSWEQKNLIDSSPAIGEDSTVYVGSYDGNLYAIDPDGKEKWSFSTGDLIHQSSAAIGQDGTIFIGSRNRQLYAIYPNGTERWSYETGDWIVSSPAIDCNGTVYVGSLNNKLYAIGKPLKYDNPIADAGENQTVDQYQLVHFDGSGSYDPYGTIDIYSWDFDADVDSNGDGNYTNDVDGTGPTPTNIYKDNGDYNVTLNVTSYGKEGEVYTVFQDTVFCVDTSDSMEFYGIFFIKYGLFEYSYGLERPDQGCIISFNDAATLMNPLSDDYDQLKNDIRSIPDPYGGDNMVDALQKAIDEIDANHITGHLKVIILATDGIVTDDTAEEVRNLAKISKAKKIRIFTVRLDAEPGSGTPDVELLNDIANQTSGKYYYVPDLIDMNDVYLEIFEHVETPILSPRYGYDTTRVTVNKLDPLDEGSPYQFNGPESHNISGRIRSYKWDFDSNVDSDSDGNYTNDVDAEGPTPSHIYGDNGIYEVTFTVTSFGKKGTYEKINHSAVFCADTSGSMSQESVGFMKEGLTIYVDEMEDPDQGCVITFGGIVNKMNDLTNDYIQLHNDIAAIPPPGGGTMMVGALNEAINELNTNNISGNIKVIILLTDGQPTDGTPAQVRALAQDAADSGIKIFTIGLEPASGFLDEQLLIDVANITGGEYYYAPDATYLKDIYEEISQRVKYPGILPQTYIFTRQVNVKNVDPIINSLDIPTFNVGSPATVTAHVSDPGSDDIKFLWDWDDATCVTTWTFYNNGMSDDPYPSPEINPVDMSSGATHIYLDAGNYTVTFFAIDDDNGTSKETFVITVLDTLSADFSWSPEPQDEGYPVQFTDLSTPAGNIVYWEWDFGGFGSSNSQNPQFTFMDDGIYPVTLMVSDTAGGGNGSPILGKAVFSDDNDWWMPSHTYSSRGDPDNTFKVIDWFEEGKSHLEVLICGSIGHLTSKDELWEASTTTTHNFTFVDTGSHQLSSLIPGMDIVIIEYVTTAWGMPYPDYDQNDADALYQYFLDGGNVLVMDDFDYGSPLFELLFNRFSIPLDLSVPVPFPQYERIDVEDDGRIIGSAILFQGNDIIFSTSSVSHNVTILDLAPTANFTWSPQSQDEGSPIQFADLSTSYPDALVGWSWDFGDGHTSSLRNTSHVYGDDGIFIVTLTVTDDDNSTGSISYNVTVLNVDPEVVIESVTMDVEIGLRVAGRKWNNVSMTLSENEKIIGYVSIKRRPGSPDEQMAWIPKVLDLTRTYSAIVHYIPVDPPFLGANPVWIYIKFPNGSIQKIHHTFNVQQSKERDSSHWNHIDPWEVDLMVHLIGWEFDVEYHVTDPGSDDEILTFSCGTQNVTVTHLRNPPNPDPYPSAEIDPVDILDIAQLVYEGAGTIILTVEDDDNIRVGSGFGSDSLDLP
jgi:outer membrane protein assembly factor BamB